MATGAPLRQLLHQINNRFRETNVGNVFFYNFSRPSLLRNSFSKNRGFGEAGYEDLKRQWRSARWWSVCRSVAQSVGKMVHYLCSCHGTCGICSPAWPFVGGDSINSAPPHQHWAIRSESQISIIESMQLLAIARAQSRHMARTHFCSWGRSTVRFPILARKVATARTIMIKDFPHRFTIGCWWGKFPHDPNFRIKLRKDRVLFCLIAARTAQPHEENGSTVTDVPRVGFPRCTISVVRGTSDAMRSRD